MAVDSPKIPLENKPGVTNWVEKYGALEPHKTNWIYRCAEHLKGKGMPEGIAIPTAKNAAVKLCSTGDLNFAGLQHANLGSRAEACAAVAKWQTAEARAKADRAKSATSLSAQRACDEFRRIDLAAAYLRHRDGEQEHLPRQATAAYLELASAEPAQVADLAFRADEPRGFHGRWSGMSAKVKALAHGNDVFVSEHQHDTIAAHALAHGEPKTLTRGTGGNVVVGFANGQLHSYGQHGGSDRLDNLPPSGGAKPPLSSAERQAIVAEEIHNARKAIAPNIPPGGGRGPSYSGAQVAAIKGIARKRALERIGSEERRRELPRHINSPAMVLTNAEPDNVVELAANFIQRAIKRPGQLHRDLGVAPGKRIARQKIVAALSHSDPKVRARARLALRLMALRKSGGAA